MSEGSIGGLGEAAERPVAFSSAPASLDNLEALHSTLPSRDATSKRLLWLLQLAARYAPHPRELCSHDYKHTITHTFSDQDGEKTSIDELAPLVFADVRASCNLEQDKFPTEWSLPWEEIASIDEKEIKDGLLIFSRSKLYFVAAISSRQADLILDGLDVYHETVLSNHNMVLLHRFGLFRIKTQHYAIFNSFLGTATSKSEYFSRIGKLLEAGTGENLKELNRIFGVPLAILVGNVKSQLPDFLPTVVRRLGQFRTIDKSFQFESLFGDDWEDRPIQKVQESLERGSTIDLVSDPKIVAAVLLSFLRDLPDDIIPKASFEALKFCLGIADKKDQLRCVQCIIVQIPAIYRSVLRYLVDTIAELASSSPDPQKALDLLCTAFAPLFIAPVRTNLSSEKFDDVSTAVGHSGGVASISTAMLSFRKAGNSNTTKPSIFSSFMLDNKKDTKKKEDSAAASKDAEISSKKSSLELSPVMRRNSVSASRNLSADDIKARAEVLKMLILCGASVFQLEVTRLKFVEEHGRVIISKATLSELLSKLLDENYEEKDFPIIFFSCLLYFSDYKTLFAEFAALFETSAPTTTSAGDKAGAKEVKEKDKPKEKDDKEKDKKSKTDKVKDQSKRASEKSGSRSRERAESDSSSGRRLSLDETEDDAVPPLTRRNRVRVFTLLNTITSSTYTQYLPHVDELRSELKAFLTTRPIGKERALKFKTLTTFLAHGTAPVSRASLINSSDGVPSEIEPPRPSIPSALAVRPSPAGRSSVENSLFKEVSVREIAEQLTLVDHSLIEKIPASELFNKLWEKPALSPFFHAVLVATNNLSEWAQWFILSADSLESRASRFGSLIDLAWECVNVGNFQSAMTFFSALHSSSVDRLKKAKAAISRASLKNLDDLSKLFAMEKNYHRYRRRLQQTNPAIPYLASFTKELFMIEEGNPSVQKEALKDGKLELINVQKFRMILSTVTRFQKYQKAAFTFTKKPQIFDYFATAQSEYKADELRQMSLKAEPKEAKSEAH